MHYNDLRTAFSYTAELLGPTTFHDLTAAFLRLLLQFEGVKATYSYEILARKQRSEDDTQLLVRRFPMSLDENFADQNEKIVSAIAFYGVHGVSFACFDKQPYVIINISENTSPEKLILIEGEVCEYDAEVIRGLALVYEKQVSLFDTKERDPLTLLSNRQTLNHTLNQVFDFYFGRTDNGLYSWIALLDIDHFKRINDNWGHLYGDEVLVHFANLIKETFRHSDFLFRYGGEEFLVIINQTDEKGVLEALERFRMRVEEYNFPSGQVTVSIGATKIRTDKAIPELVEIADEALYQSKSNGRNQVTMQQESSKHVDGGEVELF